MLTVRHKMAIDLAGQRFASEGRRQQVARETLGYGATRYWQVVNALLDDPDALAYAPMTVRRLTRLRDKRRRARSHGFRSAESI